MRPDGGAAADPPASPSDRAYRRPARRQLIGSVVRTSLMLAVVISAYALAPLDPRADVALAGYLALWLLAVFVVVVWQIRAVSRSPHPGLRGVETVAISVPLFILAFASAYFITGRVNVGSFSEPLTRLDAVYFTVTVFSTVGFGDIVAKSDPARLMVILQILADLVLIGLIAKVLFGAVQRRRGELDRETGQSSTPVRTAPPS